MLTEQPTALQAVLCLGMTFGLTKEAEERFRQ